MGHHVTSGVATLRVTVQLTDDTMPRSLDIEWTPVNGPVARRKLACARIFLVPFADESNRVYLNLVDGRQSISLELSGSLPGGEYAIEVDVYGNASWVGFGKLEARGRSAPFRIIPSGPSEAILG